MKFDTEKVLQDAGDLLELPILRKSLYFRIRELKDAISANIECYKDIMSIREMLRERDKGKKDRLIDAKGIKFEIVKINRELWIPVIPGKKNNKQSVYEIIPEAVVNFIVDLAARLDPGGIEMRSNTIIPGIRTSIFDISFEKVGEDYIHGNLKEHITIEPVEPVMLRESVDLEDLKEIDFEELKNFFRFILEMPDFRKGILKDYRKLWKPMLEMR